MTVNILKLNRWIHENNKEFLFKKINTLIQKKESQSLLNSNTMDPTWRKQSMISPQKLYKEKINDSYG